MTYDEVMKQLKSLGTAQNVKIYRRHGMGENIFGVSSANLGALKKKIKTDNALAMKLWQSGNGDARNLAIMITDPVTLTESTVDAWVKDVTYKGIAGMLARLVAQTPYAKKKADQWAKSKDEWIGVAGWDLIGCLAMDPSPLTGACFAARLNTIESSIHKAKNHTRHAMHMALISIGIRNAALEKQAIAAAKRIGKVEVDHGETGCKTPDAEAYITRGRARKAC